MHCFKLIYVIKLLPDYGSSGGMITPVDCQWDLWQTGDCSKSCGGGTRTNIRSKIVEEENGGVCIGNATITESCNEDVFCPGKFSSRTKCFVALPVLNISSKRYLAHCKLYYLQLIVNGANGYLESVL